ncbi:hypothetical protein HDV00_008853 [Rhizophlyctis rosea]|nr:hypothetical protein HDV00_008853 [Rhizophlyctis rosea]
MSRFGLVVQTCNVGYGVHHAIKRPTKFNIVLVWVIALSALSFVPLLLTTRLSIELAGVPRTEENRADFFLLDALARTFTAMYSFASLVYVLLEQIRFRLVKYFMPYSNKYDYFFVVLTVAVWALSQMLFGVIYPISPSIQLLASAGWSAYGLLVDNLLSFTLMHQLLSNRQELSSMNVADTVRRVIISLCALCASSWLALGVLVTGNVLWPEDGAMRTLFFRAAYSLTPFQFSGSLVFMYTIRALLKAPMKMRSRSQTVFSSSKENMAQSRSNLAGSMISGKESMHQKESILGKESLHQKESVVGGSRTSHASSVPASVKAVSIVVSPTGESVRSPRLLSAGKGASIWDHTRR